MLVGFRLDPRVAEGGGQRGYAWFHHGDVCETRIARRDKYPNKWLCNFWTHCINLSDTSSKKNNIYIYTWYKDRGGSMHMLKMASDDADGINVHGSKHRKTKRLLCPSASHHLSRHQPGGWRCGEAWLKLRRAVFLPFPSPFCNCKKSREHANSLSSPAPFHVSPRRIIIEIGALTDPDRDDYTRFLPTDSGSSLPDGVPWREDGRKSWKV